MKKFIFGLIIFVCIVSLAFCLSGGKESKSVEPQSEGPAKMISDNPALRHVANMVWQLGMTNSIDVEDDEALNTWQEQCEKAMLLYYDTIHPNEKISDFKKVEAVLDEVDGIIPIGRTTIDMINHSYMVYSVLMCKIVTYSKRVLQCDSTFKDEMRAWKELHGLLSNLCIGVIHSEWYGGSGCGPMMGAVRNNVLEVRVNDLRRIIQLDGGSDPATDEMITSKRDELYQAMERALKIVDKEELYMSVKKSKEALPAALEKWIHTRGKYKGCTAVAIDDMKDAVNNTHSDYQEEDIDEENVEMFEGRELQYS